MSSARSLNSFFLIWITFISFSCIIVVIKTFNTLLNKGSESGEIYIVPDLRQSVFCISQLSILLVVGAYNAFIMFRHVTSIPTFWRGFIINRR